MSLLQTLKSAVIRLNGDRNPIFDVPVARQKAFLESLPEPKDLLDRSYAQYRCQMMLERPILRVMYQAAAMLLLPVYQRQLLRRPAPQKMHFCLGTVKRSCQTHCEGSSPRYIRHTVLNAAVCCGKRIWHCFPRYAAVIHRHFISALSAW